MNIAIIDWNLCKYVESGGAMPLPHLNIMKLSNYYLLQDCKTTLLYKKEHFKYLDSFDFCIVGLGFYGEEEDLLPKEVYKIKHRVINMDMEFSKLAIKMCPPDYTLYTDFSGEYLSNGGAVENIRWHTMASLIRVCNHSCDCCYIGDRLDRSKKYAVLYNNITEVEDMESYIEEMKELKLSVKTFPIDLNQNGASLITHFKSRELLLYDWNYKVKEALLEIKQKDVVNIPIKIPIDLTHKQEKEIVKELIRLCELVKCCRHKPKIIVINPTHVSKLMKKFFNLANNYYSINTELSIAEWAARKTVDGRITVEDHIKSRGEIKDGWLTVKNMIKLVGNSWLFHIDEQKREPFRYDYFKGDDLMSKTDKEIFEKHFKPNGMLQELSEAEMEALKKEVEEKKVKGKK